MGIFFKDISDSADIEIALDKTEALKAFTAEFLGNLKTQLHIKNGINPLTVNLNIIFPNFSAPFITVSLLETEEDNWMIR